MAGNGLANVVGVIDSNRFVELVVTDGCSMIAPRTGLALWKRGPDDGRETFLREMSGLVGNMFVVGWASKAAIGAFGNRINFYNPHGIPAKAWISSENLDAFSNIYKQALQDAKTPEQARARFVHDVLAGLESGDRKFSLDSRLSALNKLEGTAKTQALEQMVEIVHGADWHKHMGGYQTLLNEGKLDGLRKKFLESGWGRLSPESRRALAEFYAQAKDPGGPKGAIRGTHNFDRWATDQLGQTKHPPPSDIRQLKRDPAFIEQRLKLSLSDLTNQTELFEKTISQEALERGLTGTVNLRKLDSATEILSHEQNRGSMLKQIKFFLEQYVDRAGHGVTEKTPGWKDHLHDLLFKDAKQSWKHYLLPGMQDGLVTATRKSKLMYSAVPMAVAILTAGALAFYNNYLTRMKHGGKVFFPGEGVPPEPTPVKSTVPFGGAQPTTQASVLSVPVYRPMAPFTPYRQPFTGSSPQRFPQRGVLA